MKRGTKKGLSSTVSITQAAQFLQMHLEYHKDICETGAARYTLVLSFPCYRSACRIWGFTGNFGVRNLSERLMNGDLESLSLREDRDFAVGDMTTGADQCPY